MERALTVVKVGGSLHDLPDLRPRLQEWLAQLGAGKVLLVPGGGATADVIRNLDRVHQLGDEVSHWLAIQAMSVNARFLQALLPDSRLISDVLGASIADASGSGVHILDALPFFQADERRPDHLPHCWEVTSDSLAVRAATLIGAEEVVVLKSAGWPGCTWPEAWRDGLLDDHFAHAMRQAPEGLRVRIINLRTWVAERTDKPHR
jgi:aspartokinase-like uncharacterized kinase